MRIENPTRPNWGKELNSIRITFQGKDRTNGFLFAPTVKYGFNDPGKNTAHTSLKQIRKFKTISRLALVREQNYIVWFWLERMSPNVDISFTADIYTNWDPPAGSTATGAQLVEQMAD
jgi:hypothetical protein